MLKSKGAEIGYLLGSLSLTAYSLSTINMNMQGVHDILHCSKASHTEVVNDLDLLTEDFEQVALDSIPSTEASPEDENGAMPNQHEYDIKRFM